MSKCHHISTLNQSGDRGLDSRLLSLACFPTPFGHVEISLSKQTHGGGILAPKTHYKYTNKSEYLG